MKFIHHLPPLNRITLGLHKSDNNNRIIQLTDIFCELLRYYGTSNIWLQYAADSIIRDPIHCIYINLIKVDLGEMRMLEVALLWCLAI